MISVVALSIAILAVRFGFSVLDKNFVPEYSTHSNSSLGFVSMFSLMNIYLYTMAFIYSPSKNAAIDSLFQHNPTFALINESDEDVVYE